MEFVTTETVSGEEIDERRFNWFVIALLFVISLNIFRQTIPALFL